MQDAHTPTNDIQAPSPVQGFLRQFWHARSTNDAGCKWLRSQVAELFRDRVSGTERDVLGARTHEGARAGE